MRGGATGLSGSGCPHHGGGTGRAWVGRLPTWANLHGLLLLGLPRGPTAVVLFLPRPLLPPFCGCDPKGTSS